MHGFLKYTLRNIKNTRELLKIAHV